MDELQPQPYTTQPGRVAVVADIFPATVNFQFVPQTVTKARFVLTQAGTVYVFTDSSYGPALLYSGVVTASEGVKKDMTITTPDGVLTSVKAGGCGCGSRLRGFRPFEQSINVG